MAFWTAQLTECVEEDVDKRNGVGCGGSGCVHPLGIRGGMDGTQGVVRGKGAQQVPRLPPDFLSGFVVSINPVRLSLPKAAYVAVY